MTQWEYRIEFIDLYVSQRDPKPEIMLMLNTLGAEGWEAVTSGKQRERLRYFQETNFKVTHYQKSRSLGLNLLVGLAVTTYKSSATIPRGFRDTRNSPSYRKSPVLALVNFTRTVWKTGRSCGSISIVKRPCS